MNNLQNISDIPIFTVVDEEGGNFVRVSSNPALRDEIFLPRELYALGGLDNIEMILKKRVGYLIVLTLMLI